MDVVLVVCSSILGGCIVWCAEHYAKREREQAEADCAAREQHWRSERDAAVQLYNTTSDELVKIKIDTAYKDGYKAGYRQASAEIQNTHVSTGMAEVMEKGLKSGKSVAFCVK